MKVNIFTYCDFAAENGNKLSITGASHMIYVPDIPARVTCFIVGKIIIEREDEGDHLLDSTIRDADGRVVCQCPRQQLTARAFLELPQECEVYFHCMIHHVTFQLYKYGEYVLELRDNGQILVSTVLMVARLDTKSA